MISKSPVALVTGGGSGIGEGISRRLVKDGFIVVAGYLNSEAGAIAAVRGESNIGRSMHLDVTDHVGVTAAMRQIEADYGRLDVLVNNAGQIVRPADWASISEADWDRTLDVNLSGGFRCIRAFASLLKASPQGRIVNIASTYGILGSQWVIAYTAAKAGVINMTRSFAKELAPHVTVNAVAPGNIDTPMTRSAGDELISQVIAETPLRRLGTVDDVAAAVAFLVSKEAEFITGVLLPVDGGHMLR